MSVEAFAALHVPGRPVLLPNAWDVASAAALARAGFAAIGTTSLGVSAAVGLADGAGATRDLTLDLARRLGQLDTLVTVDGEQGFGDAVAFCRQLRAAGIVGVNLEDGQAEPDQLAAIIRTVKGSGLFINARTDTYWLTERPSWTDTVERVEAYLAAGADGIFVPGLADPDRIRELAAGCRLNVLYQPGALTLAELARLGVARVSTGSLLYRTAVGAAVDLARTIRDPGAAPLGAPSYTQLARGSERQRGPAACER